MADFSSGDTVDVTQAFEELSASARDHARSSDLRFLAKRLLDVTGSAIGLLLLSPLFAVLALAIRLDSKGPALYKQARLGKDGVPFVFYKFRTMTAGTACDVHKEYVTNLITSCSEDLKGDSGSYKLEDDDRVTRVGHYLRRTSVDELPQLWNVLRGDMSLVGPRPPLEYEVELYTPWQGRRLEVLPGMTGLWQVSGRNQLTYEQMIELDIAYIDDWSLGLDLSILWRTVSVVLTRRGAW